MNKLLIHSNNTSFNRDPFFHVSEQFVFDVDLDKDIDFYIDENLTAGDLKAKLELADLVFIKVSLSQNYLEYLGIRLAYHIRLTKSLGAKANLPIVFIAEESLQFLGITYKEPSILFTRGIYLIKELASDFQKAVTWYNEGYIKKLEGLDEFVKAININPPANYQSHHSIANEWSILRWSKVLEISPDNKSLQGVKKNIESLLYYKFLQLKYPIHNEPNKANFKIQGKGKILYIDDEWSKGWDVVLNTFASSSPEVLFETFKYDFKDKSQETILSDCKQKIQNSKPDVVLLDLRLSDSDFSNTIKSKELTGFKVLQTIKSINPGIQVLIFTASNKVWNFTELQYAGADDFILKESPELSSDVEYSKGALEKLASSISIAFKMSFLKEIHLKIMEIESLAATTSDEEESEFSIRLINNLGIAFKLLLDTKYSSKYFNYAYLQLFQIIEDFCEMSSVFIEDSDSFVIVNGKEVCVQKTIKNKYEWPISLTHNGKYELKSKTFDLYQGNKQRRLDTNFKVSALLIFRYGNSNSSIMNWTTIYLNRNTKAAHFNIDNILSKSDIHLILDFLKYILNKKNQNELNIGKGLKVKSLEESLELLKSQYKK